jgi:hypothetical protein
MVQESRSQHRTSPRCFVFEIDECLMPGGHRGKALRPGSELFVTVVRATQPQVTERRRAFEGRTPFFVLGDTQGNFESLQAVEYVV